MKILAVASTLLAAWVLAVPPLEAAPLAPVQASISATYTAFGGTQCAFSSSSPSQIVEQSFDCTDQGLGGKAYAIAGVAYGLFISAEVIASGPTQSVRTTASLTDNLTFTGGTGTGYVTFFADTSGLATWNCSHPTRGCDDSSGSLDLTMLSNLTGGSEFFSYQVVHADLTGSAGQTLVTPFTLQTPFIPLVWGETFDYTFLYDAFALGCCVASSAFTDIYVDPPLSRVTGFLITDANGNPVSGVNVVSAAGAQYTNFGTSSSVPEPATLTLLGLGLAGLGFSRRRR